MEAGGTTVTSRQRGMRKRTATAGNGTRDVYSRIIMALVCLTALLVAPAVAMAFLQSPDEPSPATGTAQVVAQEVITIDADDLVWQIVERTGPLPANAAKLTSRLGFLIVESGVLLVDDLTSGVQSRLPAGEAMVTGAGDEQIRAALGADPVLYHELSLVDATGSVAEDATLLFTSDPFPGTGARYDVDLLQDTLAAGAQMVIPAGPLPTLVLVRTGAADIATEAGDIISLGVGEAVSLTGVVQVTAAGEGASIAAVSVGPVVPSLAQAAATPASGRQIVEVPDATATTAAQTPQIATPAPTTDEQASGPVAEDEAPVEIAGSVDSDGDGLDDATESELGTDPLLWDTDSDGVSDGEEVAAGTDPLDPASVPVRADAAPGGSSLDSDADRLADVDEAAFGTDPNNPDSDGDGYYDGDEVNLGTDPLDSTSFPAG